MIITRIEEFQIIEAVQQAISQLLATAFSTYPPGRTYYKQKPSFRYLAWEDDKLIGHLAVEHRMISIGGRETPIFGIADLCISPNHQQKQIASELLQQLEQLGKSHGIQFLLLVAQEHGVYLKNGFRLVHNPCKWLIIQEHQSLGLGHRKLKDCLMVKALGPLKWSDGLVDFMGHIF